MWKRSWTTNYVNVRFDCGWMLKRNSNLITRNVTTVKISKRLTKTTIRIKLFSKILKTLSSVANNFDFAILQALVFALGVNKKNSSTSEFRSIKPKKFFSFYQRQKMLPQRQQPELRKIFLPERVFLKPTLPRHHLKSRCCLCGDKENEANKNRKKQKFNFRSDEFSILRPLEAEINHPASSNRELSFWLFEVVFKYYFDIFLVLPI